MSIPGNANPLLLATAAAAAAAGVATRSLRFNSAYLHRTPSSAGNLRTHTFAAWVKRSALGGRQTLFRTNTSEMHYSFAESAQGNENAFFCYGGAGAVYLVSDPVFRDPSAWFHLCVAWDTTQSTSTDRLKLYINGVRQTSWKTSTFPSQNFEGGLNKANKHGLGANSSGGEPFSGYLADVYFIDGSALSPVDNFIELDDNGVYQAKAYSGTFGTNGFHLPFSDATSTTTIAEDNSGNSSDFTASGISVTAGSGNDSLFDSPKNGDQTDSGAGGEVSGNYCTWNPIAEYNPSPTFSNGNLEFTASSDWHIARGTIGVKTGKYYAEFTTVGVTMLGIETEAASAGRPYYNNSVGCIALRSNGKVFIDDVEQTQLGGWSDGNVIGMAVDLDGGSLVVTKNGSAYTTISIPSNSYWNDKNVFYSATALDSSDSVTANWGQRAFSNSAPSNHKCLCTTNLPTPTIADGSDYFEAKTYTGNGGSQSITTGHSSDFVWIKRRDASAALVVFDSVRGVTKALETSNNGAEKTNDPALSSFDSTGFSMNTAVGQINGSSNSYVAWSWDAGSSTASNTDGSITSSVRANQTAGFSIVTFTGTGSNATVGHGLNNKPDFYTVKRRNAADDWETYHSSLGATKYGKLNATDSFTTAGGTSRWNDTEPTSSVFSVGTTDNVNGSGSTYVAYVMSAVDGYSAFGEYDGNGSSTDGPFLHTGHRPAWIMVKCHNTTVTSGNWIIWDTTRDPFNMAEIPLRADLSNTEIAASDNYDIDILSNGFKIRTSNGGINHASRSYVFVSFAENPFQANGGLAR